MSEQAAPPRYEVREKSPGRWWIWDLMENAWAGPYGRWIGETRYQPDEGCPDKAALQAEVDRDNNAVAGDRSYYLKYAKESLFAVQTIWFWNSQDWQRFKAGLEIHWGWKMGRNFGWLRHGGLYRIDRLSETKSSDEVLALAHLVNARITAMSGKPSKTENDGYYLIVDKDAPQFAG
jgi:hypothetical protein